MGKNGCVGIWLASGLSCPGEMYPRGWKECGEWKAEIAKGSERGEELSESWSGISAVGIGRGTGCMKYHPAGSTDDEVGDRGGWLIQYGTEVPDIGAACVGEGKKPYGSGGACAANKGGTKVESVICCVKP